MMDIKADFWTKGMLENKRKLRKKLLSKSDIKPDIPRMTKVTKRSHPNKSPTGYSPHDIATDILAGVCAPDSQQMGIISQAYCDLESENSQIKAALKNLLDEFQCRVGGGYEGLVNRAQRALEMSGGVK